MSKWYVSDVMTAAVPSVRADTPYRTVAALLTRHNVGVVPVVEARHQLIGVISVNDLVGDRACGAATARDLMGPCPKTVRPDMPLGAAARQLDHDSAANIFVADSTGRLAGVVSRQDLLGAGIRDDQDVQEDVAEKVLWRALGLDRLAVQAEVNHGIVDLSGQVAGQGIADIATILTKAVPGVTNVVNRLRWDSADDPQSSAHAEEFVHIGHPRPAKPMQP